MMNEFYKKLIERTETQKNKDEETQKRESVLLEIKDERTIPKLKTSFKRRGQRKWKKR